MKIPTLIISLNLSFAALAQTPNTTAVNSQPNNPANATTGSRITFDSLVFNFGKVSAGEVVKHDFVFTNTGTALLEITDVHPGCGCTTAGTWDKAVEPGKTGRIPLQFNSSGFGGMVSKSATITCNDPAHPSVILELTGTVWKPIDVSPAMVIFNVASDGQTNETKKIRIVNNTEQPITVSDLECTNQEFRVALKPVTPGKEYEVEVTSQPPFTVPNVFAQIHAKTSYDKMAMLNMSAYLMVQPPVSIAPSQLVLTGPTTNSTSYLVTIRNQSTNSLQISDAKSDLPGVEVRINEVQPGRLYTLAIMFPDGLKMKPGETARITAKSSHPKLPLITIPVIQTYSVGQHAAVTETQTQPVVPRVRTLSGRRSSNDQPAK
ncbi:MAG TPA: DUF1573 domain-containing protein [Verrucomicrobiae bacterium]|nr:DUF1573 domain-containing protein [Verrucomicrobiae bacterium]